MIYLKNIREKQTVHIPRTEINSKVVVIKSYDEGYADGIVEGKKLQKLKLTNLTVSENGVYKREDGWNEVEIDVDVKPYLQSKTINVTKDVEIVMADDVFDGLSKVDVNATQYGRDKRNEGYTDGYTTGKADGTEEGYQSGKQDGIEEGYQNGYNTGKEDGTEEGYAQGKTDGYTEGYEDGIAEGGKIDVDDTQVMNITANGTYTTQYTKSEDVSRDITGYFDDNTPFYGYAHLTNHTIATGLIATKTSKVELWWRPDFNGSGSVQYIFANSSPLFSGFYLKVDGGKFSVKFGNYTKNNLLVVEDKCYHIVVSTDGLVIDGETITTLGTPSVLIAGNNMFINGDGAALNPVCANGYFGMVKIDGKTFIPTEDGFIDYATNIPLNVYTAGGYDFVENPTYEGNLIRTVHVNVPQNTLKTQNKILTVTKDLEVVYPDSGYNALAEVSVDATQYGQEKQNEGYTEGRLQGKTEGYENGKADGIEEGYNQGYADGKAEGGSITTKPLYVYPKWEDANLVGDITYRPETYDAQAFSLVTVNVETLYGEGEEAGYAAGYEVGKADGISEQKAKLTNLTVTENGTYSNTDGWNSVSVSVSQANIKTQTKTLVVTKDSEVVVPDSNYDGLSKVTVNASQYGQTKRNEGYEEGYDEGYERGIFNTKISMKNGTKFAYSTFKSVPSSSLDWDGVKDMSFMFYECQNLTTIPSIDTSSVTTMYNAFYGCKNIETIPLLDTSNVTNMQGAFYSCTKLIDISEIDTSSVTDMDMMFYGCTKLNRLPALDCSKVTSIDQFFGNYTITNLLYFGGFINLKRSMTTDGLEKAPNLNETACINVLNGLYDFTGNNQTPTSSQGKLKVHQNFLDKVGSRISIATNKGWTITA